MRSAAAAAIGRAEAGQGGGRAGGLLVCRTFQGGVCRGEHDALQPDAALGEQVIDVPVAAAVASDVARDAGAEAAGGAASVDVAAATDAQAAKAADGQRTIL